MLPLPDDILARLERIGVVARQAMESLLSGEHRSLKRGLSVEFAGHRTYQPGDDIRSLDWLVYARSDRYDVRVYHEETRLRALLVVDTSGSMDFRSRTDLPTKFDYARRMAAVLAALLVRRSDAVGLALGGQELATHLPPAATMAHLVTMLNRLETVKPQGATALAALLDQAAQHCRRRGLVILISDCCDDPAALVLALGALRHRRQEVRVFQLSDPGEESLPVRGMVEVEGCEGEPRLRLDADRVRGAYRQALVEHRRRLAEGCHAIGIPITVCRTDEDLVAVLLRTLGPAQVRTAWR